MPSGLELGTLANEGNAAALAKAVGTGGAYNTATVHLYLSSFSPGPNSKAADYAAAEAKLAVATLDTLTWSAPGVDSSDTPTALSERVFFQNNDPANPETVGGVWVETSVPGPPVSQAALVFYPFTVPVTIGSDGGFLGVVIGLQTPSGAGYAIIDY